MSWFFRSVYMIKHLLGLQLSVCIKYYAGVFIFQCPVSLYNIIKIPYQGVYLCPPMLLSTLLQCPILLCCKWIHCQWIIHTDNTHYYNIASSIQTKIFCRSASTSISAVLFWRQYISNHAWYCDVVQITNVQKLLNLTKIEIECLPYIITPITH